MIRFSQLANRKSEHYDKWAKTTLTKISLIVYIALSGFSCKLSPTEVQLESLPEDRGTILTSLIPTSFVNLIWSRNTDEIITAGQSGIQAINVTSFVQRSIESAGSVYYIKLFNDGNSLYYLLGNSLGGDLPLYKISVAGKSRQLLLNQVLSRFSLSSDSLIAHGVSSLGNIYLYNETSTTDTFLTRGWFPLTFSPDAKQLLYSDSSFSYFKISLENKVVQSIPFYQEHFVGFFRWNMSGIQVIYSELGVGWFVKNITTNETYKITGIDDGPQTFTWSSDGNKIAYWTSKCIKTSGWLGCALSQDILHVLDVNTKKETLVAVHNVEESENFPISIAFSPNNSKIAYALGSQIYTKNIP